MNLRDIHELHFITDITNVASILRDGILSHNEARLVHHRSIAEQGVQERRQNKKIPGTNKHLHDYEAPGSVIEMGVNMTDCPLCKRLNI